MAGDILSRMKSLNRQTPKAEPVKQNNFGGNHGDFRNHGGNRSYGRQNSYSEKKFSEPNRNSSEFGSAFTNPYTFIPFPKNALPRTKPSLLTAEEFDSADRYTGVLKLEVKTVSPLLSINPEKSAEAPKAVRPEYDSVPYHKVLSIGNDVIVPATSIRGSLRNLMTVLAGSSLGYLDTNMWLCQARDLALGKTQANPSGHPILAMVEVPGSSSHAGTIRAGETRLILASDLESLAKRSRLEIKNLRPTTARNTCYVDDCENPNRISTTPIDGGWMVKFSGRPVGNKDKKKEGLFRPDMSPNALIELPVKFWADYENRNRNGSHSKLKKGDLVWIAPTNGAASRVGTATEIASIQWARWGKQGTNLNDALPPHVRPDAAKPDGNVDPVSNLFGLVPMESAKGGKAFAGRIRCHNLVFRNGCANLEKDVTLAVLGTPHPGCLAFYRDASSENVSANSDLKGYKVYRNSAETGSSAPWNYSVQGVYGGSGKIDYSKASNMTKRVELLKSEQIGSLKLSVRSLSKYELALLLLTCSADWKLGGGKPLGLGHCQVQNVKFVDEDGEEKLLMDRSSGIMELPADFADLVKEFKERFDLYQKSQQPVEKLRYPRAVGMNGNDVRREGLQWFTRFAKMNQPKKGYKVGVGLTPVRMSDGVVYSGQTLPALSMTTDDFLYGYDLVPTGLTKTHERQTQLNAFEVFDENKRYMESNRGENTSQNAVTRQWHRDERRNA